MSKKPRCCLFPYPVCHTQHVSTLTLRTLTCNKLSHCLFDFDCVDFSEYKEEQYNYQEFVYKSSARSKPRGMLHDQRQSEHLTSMDTILVRD